jgi:acetoin utilization deacetylase AcuC-like enzyme
MDPLSSLNLSSRGYLNIVTGMANLAEEICENRWSVFLEGGYNVSALADVVGSCMAMASGAEPETRYDEVSDQENLGSEWVSEARSVQSKHWDV